MRKRTIFKFLLIIAYISLFVLFIIYAKWESRTSVEHCDEPPCVRLCSVHLNSSESHNFEIYNSIVNKTTIYKVLGGKPCEIMRIFDNTTWNFTAVSSYESASVTFFQQILLLERIYFCKWRILLSGRVLSRFCRRWENCFRSLYNFHLRRSLKILFSNLSDL